MNGDAQRAWPWKIGPRGQELRARTQPKGRGREVPEKERKTGKRSWNLRLRVTSYLNLKPRRKGGTRAQREGKERRNQHLRLLLGKHPSTNKDKKDPVKDCRGRRIFPDIQGS